MSRRNPYLDQLLDLASFPVLLVGLSDFYWCMTSTPRTKPKPRPWQQGDDEPVSFGSWLRRQRVMREIEVSDIAAATKISRRYLEAFEEDQFDCLPAPIFAKGFLREYAKFIGVDPDEAVTLYLSALQDLEPEEEESSGATGGLGRAGSGQDSNWLYHLLIVVAVAIALLAVFAFSFRAASRQRDKSLSDPPATTAQPGPSASSTPAMGSAASVEADGALSLVETPRPGVADSTAPPIRVTLDFKRNCWVEIQVDNQRRIEELRVEGESVQISAERLVVMKLGDAGAVEVHVNGRPYSLGRGSGQVARATIDLDTVEELTGPT